MRDFLKLALFVVAYVVAIVCIVVIWRVAACSYQLIETRSELAILGQEIADVEWRFPKMSDDTNPEGFKHLQAAKNCRNQALRRLEEHRDLLTWDHNLVSKPIKEGCSHIRLIKGR